MDERATHDAQIFYYLGCAYAQLGDKAEANAWFEKAAAQDYNLKGSKDYRYWTGLALKKLGRKAEAKAIFKSMIAEGKAGMVTEFINFYGAEGTTGKTVESINASAYYTKALGQLGLGRKWSARRTLRKVIELRPADLWAARLLESYE